MFCPKIYKRETNSDNVEWIFYHQVAAMTYDGRPVTDSQTKINMQVFPSYGTTGSGTPIYIQPKTPVNGIAQFQIPIDVHLKSLKLAVSI